MCPNQTTLRVLLLLWLIRRQRRRRQRGRRSDETTTTRVTASPIDILLITIVSLPQPVLLVVVLLLLLPMLMDDNMGKLDINNVAHNDVPGCATYVNGAWVPSKGSSLGNRDSSWSESVWSESGWHYPCGHWWDYNCTVRADSCAQVNQSCERTMAR